MSGTVTVTPGYTFTSSSDVETNAKLNQIGNPSMQVGAGQITFREIAFSRTPIDPSLNAVLFEDFLGSTNANSLIGNNRLSYLKNGTNAALAITASTTGTAGLVLFTDTSDPTGYTIIRGAASKESWVPGGGEITVEWRILAPTRVADVTDNYQLFIGLGNGGTDASEPTDGVYFFYNYATSSGKWVGKTGNSSSYTSVVSTTTMAINTWYDLKAVISADGTLVTFYVNGTSFGTSSTHIPTAALSPICGMNTTAGTAQTITFRADWVSVQQTFTNAR